MSRHPAAACAAVPVAAAALLVLALGIAPSPPAAGDPDVPAADAPADPAAADTGLSAAERLGKRIYLSGLGSAEVVAVVGDGGFEVPASALPCAGCHGVDGRGRPEGGVSPSVLTWESLTRPYGVRHAGGREHPPYTPALLARAIADGVDPAGNPLHVAMPRYRMAPADLEALVGYLRRLSADADPGVGEEAVVLGVILPPAGSSSPAEELLRRTLERHAAEISARGGVFGRRLELRFFSPPAAAATAAARREAVAAWLEREPVFALAPSWIAGADRELAALAAERRLPMIAPITREPREGFPLNRWVFYLLPGVGGQGRALAEAAMQTPVAGPPPAAAIVHLDGPEWVEAAGEVAAQWRRRGGGERLRLSYPAGRFDPAAAAASLAREGVERVFFLGPAADAAALLRAAAAGGDGGDGVLLELSLPGDLAGPELAALSPELAARVTLALPVPPSGLGTGGAEAAIRAGAELLVAGLERAGRRLSREGLVTALEGLYEHSTGYGPSLTYGPNRRVGSRAAWVVRADPVSGNLVPAGGWVAY